MGKALNHLRLIWNLFFQFIFSPQLTYAQSLMEFLNIRVFGLICSLGADEFQYKY